MTRSWCTRHSEATRPPAPFPVSVSRLPTTLELEASALNCAAREDLSLYGRVSLALSSKCRCSQQMTPICAKSLRRWATTASDGASLVRLRRGSFEMAHCCLLCPAEIGEGAADFYLARTARRGALCFGIAVANRDSGKSLLLGTLRLPAPATLRAAAGGRPTWP